MLQLRVAQKRLSTLFGERDGFHGQEEGSFQDMVRYIISTAYSHSLENGRISQPRPSDMVDWDTHSYNPGAYTTTHCNAPSFAIP